MKSNLFTSLTTQNTIEKNLYYFTDKKKHTMPHSTSISNWSTSIPVHKQETVAFLQRKPLSWSSGKPSQCLYIFKAPILLGSSWNLKPIVA